MCTLSGRTYNIPIQVVIATISKVVFVIVPLVEMLYKMELSYYILLKTESSSIILESSAPMNQSFK